MPNASNKLPGLQIARAFAALSIAYFHSWHVTMRFPKGTDHPIVFLRDYGWVAVDFFFAISGFVICLVAAKAKFNPITFMVRRVFRLYPLWILTSYLFFDITQYIGRSEKLTAPFFHYSLSLLPTEGMPFYDLGWSLQHEMAFYVLAALLIPIGGIWLLAAALFAGSIAGRLFDLPWYLEQYFSYYPNFLVGVAAYLAFNRTRRLGVVLPMVAAAVTFYLMTRVYSSPRLYFSAPLLFLMIGFLNIKTDRAGLSLLGDSSYSIYLIHPLVFYLVFINLPTPLPPIWSQEIIRFGAIAVVSLISIGSWLLFESAMIGSGEKVCKAITSLLRRSPATRQVVGSTRHSTRMM